VDLVVASGASGTQIRGIILYQIVEGEIRVLNQVPDALEITADIQTALLGSTPKSSDVEFLISLVDKGFNIATYYSGSENDLYLSVILSPLEDPACYEIILEICMNYIIRYLDSYQKHFGYLLQLIIDFPQLTYEQQVCKMCLEPQNSFIFKTLKERGFISKYELSTKLRDQFQSIINVDHFLSPLQKIGLLKVLPDPKNDNDELVFLIRDYFLNRVPPTQTIKFARRKEFPGASTYLAEVRDFFESYIISNEDELQIISIFTDFDYYCLIEALRTKPISIDDLVTVTPHHRATISNLADRLKKLKLLDIISLYEEFPNMILLKTDICCRVFFPEHFLSSYKDRITSDDGYKIKIHLELLKESYYSFSGLSPEIKYIPYQIKSINQILKRIEDPSSIQEEFIPIKNISNIFNEFYEDSWAIITTQSPQLESDIARFAKVLGEARSSTVSLYEAESLIDLLRSMIGDQAGLSALEEVDNYLESMRIPTKYRNQLMLLAGIVNEKDNSDLIELTRLFHDITQVKYSFAEISKIIDTLRLDPADADVFLETFGIFEEKDKEKIINMLNLKDLTKAPVPPTTQKIGEIPAKVQVSLPKIKTLPRLETRTQGTQPTSETVKHAAETLPVIGSDSSITIPPSTPPKPEIIPLEQGQITQYRQKLRHRVPWRQTLQRMNCQRGWSF